jgi:TolB-like protein
LRYLFDGYVLDTERRELRHGAGVVSLEPQVFDILEYLIRNREHVVSKDDLFASIWNGRLVSESALSTRINAARSAIGDNGDEQRLIRTVFRRGFRFVGAVCEEQKPAAVATEPPRAVQPERLSIAVLPFSNMSGDPDQEHFADGITEDIITALSKLRGLHVIGRNSAFVYQGKSIPIKQAGAELGARYILEGSVRKAGDRLRVTGQLVEAATDQHLWAERYDPDLKDIFAIQDEITERVVNAVEPAVRAWEQRHGISGLRDGLERDEASPTQRTAAERRQLTIMSCELLGTAALAARMELEDLRDATGAYHRWIADTIARFGGFIGERGGSGVLAYFGYPAAHEDDAEQAVRAGTLRVRESFPAQCRCRTALSNRDCHRACDRRRSHGRRRRAGRRHRWQGPRASRTAAVVGATGCGGDRGTNQAADREPVRLPRSRRNRGIRHHGADPGVAGYGDRRCREPFRGAAFGWPDAAGRPR